MNGRYTFLLVCLLLTLPISSSRTTNNGEETLVNITLADGLAGDMVRRMLFAEGVKPPSQEEVVQVPAASACKAPRARNAAASDGSIILFTVVLR